MNIATWMKAVGDITEQGLYKIKFMDYHKLTPLK